MRLIDLEDAAYASLYEKLKGLPPRSPKYSLKLVLTMDL